VTSTQLLGPYKPAAYRVEFDSLYTNTVLVTPYRGAGRPQGCFVMERTMDAIAAAVGADRTLVRERNFIQPGEMPYDQGLIFQDGRPLIYDSGDYPALLVQLKEMISWDEFPAYQAAAAAEGRTVGIGLACYVEGTGVGPYEGGHVVVETSGKVKVATGLTTQGQGHQTVLAQIVADELGVALEDVEVVTGDTRRFGYAVGTFASRTAVMSGSAVALAARKAREKALRVAAGALEVSPDDLVIADGIVQVKGDPDSGIALGTVAVLSNPLRYAFDDAAKAEKLIRNLAQRLEREAPGVSKSILEGLDEILTVTRLGLPAELRRSLACTNIIENMMGTVRRVTRNVKRWSSPSMALRWTAAAMHEAKKGFRRLKAFRQLPALRAALAAHYERETNSHAVAQNAKAA